MTERKRLGTCRSQLMLTVSNIAMPAFPLFDATQEGKHVLATRIPSGLAM